MKVETGRFGVLDVRKEDIICFNEGLLGFEHLSKFFIVDLGDNTLILWIQSIDDPKVAFPILEPKMFSPSYSIKLLPAELASLDLERLSDASVYSILTIPPKAVTQMTANLKAPIVINNKTKMARQIVLQDNKLDVSFPMYDGLKEYTASYSMNHGTDKGLDKPKPSVVTNPASGSRPTQSP